MSIALAAILIGMGMYMLYALSSKQLGKTKNSPLHFLTRYITIMRIFAFVLFFIAGSLCIAVYGSSIGFVSWWLFATPLVFILILYINDLNPKKESRHNSSKSQ